MFDELIQRLKQGYRTMPFPSDALRLPDRYRGRPVIRAGDLSAGEIDRTIAACPVGALRRDAKGGLTLDMGACIFCGACEATGTGAVSFSREYRLAGRQREHLLTTALAAPRMPPLDEARRRLFARSLKLREVSAGGCNACEADTNVLATLAWDLGRFGIQFVASPRHADGLFVTGPVTENMRLALLKTWEAIPGPRVCIVAGACAIAGGPFAGHAECHDGATRLLPVDLFIPGCPPHPATILDALLRFLGRIP